MPTRHLVAAAGPDLLYKTNSYSVANSSTGYAWANALLGATAADRTIYIALAYRELSAAATVTMTVGGVSATQVHAYETLYSSAYSGVQLWAIADTTNVSADIVVNITGGSTCTFEWMATYNCTGLTDPFTAQATADYSGTTGTLDLNVTANQLGFGLSCDASTSSTVTWTGLTEDFDLEADDGGVPRCFSCASYAFTGTESPRTITAARTGSGTAVLATCVTVQ